MMFQTLKKIRSKIIFSLTLTSIIFIAYPACAEGVNIDGSWNVILTPMLLSCPDREIKRPTSYSDLESFFRSKLSFSLYLDYTEEYVDDGVTYKDRLTGSIYDILAIDKNGETHSYDGVLKDETHQSYVGTYYSFRLIGDNDNLIELTRTSTIKQSRWERIKEAFSDEGKGNEKSSVIIQAHVNTVEQTMSGNFVFLMSTGNTECLRFYSLGAQRK